MTECPAHLKKKIDEFIATAETLAATHPHAVVLLMHEVSRNSYPSDPYIPFDDSHHRLHAFEEVLDRAIEAGRVWRSIGSYGPEPWGARPEQTEELKTRTGAVYGALWQEYPETIVEEAKALIEERFANNDVPLSLIEGKRVIDIGSGSGRYSCGLGLLGAASVTGVDYSDSGLALARELAERAGLDNVRFEKANILELPFEDESFEFAWCNGVTMFTGDMEQATRELHRVLESGGHGWYYVYGAGGAFWYLRRRINDFFEQAGIPLEYALSVLRTIGMPGNRHIFADNWYVPMEEHISKADFEAQLRRIGFSDFRRCFHGRATDPDLLVETGSDEDRMMWGDGELRYLVTR